MSDKSKPRQIRMKAQIGVHDLEIKARQVRRLLEAGFRVKVDMRFRGREIAFVDAGSDKMKSLYEMVKDYCVLGNRLNLKGNNLSVVFQPFDRKERVAAR